MKTKADDSNKKFQNLKKILSEMDSILVAYSGGVDSTFVLKVAKDVLGEGVVAVTANSAVYPSEELKGAESLALKFGIRHKVIETRELSNLSFIANPEDRCYWCKRELFTELVGIAREYHLKYVLDGTNVDDGDDFRPGMQAASQLGIRSPLKEASLTKADIRSLSKGLGLPVWDKPSFACLASRFPYGMKISRENLIKVDKAERFLKQLRLTQVRVRHHDTIARIEVPGKDIPKLLDEKSRSHLVSYLKGLGYVYLTVDLEGYRTGSMNEVLKRGKKR